MLASETRQILSRVGSLVARNQVSGGRDGRAPCLSGQNFMGVGGGAGGFWASAVI